MRRKKRRIEGSAREKKSDWRGRKLRRRPGRRHGTTIWSRPGTVNIRLRGRRAWMMKIAKCLDVK